MRYSLSSLSNHHLKKLLEDGESSLLWFHTIRNRTFSSLEKNKNYRVGHYFSSDNPCPHVQMYLPGDASMLSRDDVLESYVSDSALITWTDSWGSYCSTATISAWSWEFPKEEKMTFQFGDRYINNRKHGQNTNLDTFHITVSHTASISRIPKQNHHETCPWKILLEGNNKQRLWVPHAILWQNWENKHSTDALKAQA